METNFAVTQKGGSLGEISGKPRYKGRMIVKEGLSKTDALALAKRLRKYLSPGEKEYYKIGYNVVEIKQLKGVTDVKKRKKLLG